MRGNTIRSIRINIETGFRVSILEHVRGVALLPEDASNLQFILCFPEMKDLKRFLDEAIIIYDREKGHYDVLKE